MRRWANESSFTSITLQQRSRRRLRLLKWLAVFVPATAIYAAETIRHEFIQPSHHSDSSLAGNLIVGLIVLICSWIFAEVIFRRVESIQTALERRNEHLEVINWIATETGSPGDAVDLIAERAVQMVAPLFPGDQIWLQLRSAPPPDQQASDRGMTVQIRIQNGIAGHLRVERSDAPLTASDRQLLQLIGDTLSMALENAALTEALRSAAVSEERNRLAREMHDGVAQYLVYAQIQLGTIGMLIREGNSQRARTELEKLQTATEQANDDVRADIAGLRILASSDTTLLNRLRAFVDDFEEQTGVHATFTVGASFPDLPIDHELQLVRILQECLTNVRKHAHATSVQIHLGVVDSFARLVIVDDGNGFVQNDSLDLERQQSFGLVMMKERAESVGGAVRIKSRPGEGTSVEVQFPLHLTKSYAHASD